MEAGRSGRRWRARRRAWTGCASTRGPWTSGARGSGTSRGCSGSPASAATDGYEAFRQVIIRRPLDQVSDDLLVHELCHVWQEQHGALQDVALVPVLGYRDNPYEVEARRAVAESR